MTALSDSILELRSQGKTYNEICQELGCSKGTVAYHLGEGQKQASQERLKRRRRTVREYLTKVKQETPCADCGENYPYWIMQFDHLGDKSFTIAAYRHEGKNLEDVKKELKKCEVVCANCHATRSHMRRSLSATISDTEDISHYYS